MSGFVTGSETLFDGVSQLQAGQLALWRAGEPEPRLHRYYTFYPRQIQAEDPAMLIDQLGQATDRIFERLVDRAAGRPIWVPLSGGLDSRLIICKLAEMGYPRLTAFSYGAPGNYEAKAAARVARRLGVRWIYLPTSRASSRRFFESTMRQRYWEFAGAHCSVPNMQDIISLLALRESGRLPEDAVLVNGQTGDFISGNHILPSLMDQPISLDRVVRVIIEKHYALWKPLCTEERLEQVGQRVREVMSWAPDRVTTIQEAAAWYEAWEWQERQAKYVINGQRSYDFLGLDWQLPLWELEYMTFWPGVPLAWRYRQQLYRDYLLRYDYAALFQRFSPNLRSWPEPWSGLLMLAGLVRRLGGRRAHAAFLRYASYVGHYSYQYAPYGLVRFCRNIDPARHAVAFWGGSWLAQLGALSGELPGGADAYRLR